MFCRSLNWMAALLAALLPAARVVVAEAAAAAVVVVVVVAVSAAPKVVDVLPVVVVLAVVAGVAGAAAAEAVSEELAAALADPAPWLEGLLLPRRELKLVTPLMPPMPPSSCTSWCWLMLLSRFCSSSSPMLFRSDWRLVPEPPAPPAPPRDDPGMGGLFRNSFTLRTSSSSLSFLGSCIQ
uniref:Secreted protein n=1 Tax=Ixodes ricinus TaxID=34613 RepID=A0A6B0V0A7_IXORI